MSFGNQKKVCIDCSNEFVAHSYNSIRCPKCIINYKIELKKKSDKNYKEKHREQSTKYLKNYYEKNKINIGKPVRICPLCNIEFISDSNHQKYCQDCRIITVKKIYNSRKIGNNNDKLSENYYKNIDHNRYIALKNYYKRTLNPNTRLRQIESGASKRGLEFNIGLAWYIENGWKKNCHYCGRETLDGLDRIDNNVGYIENNCVSCCPDCNKAKSTLSKDGFIGMCLLVVNNLKLIK